MREFVQSSVFTNTLSVEPSATVTLFPDVYLFTYPSASDHRGTNMFPYQSDFFEKIVGKKLDIQQINMTNTYAGSFRGIHATQSPPGQEKYVYCSSGEILDYIIDLRQNSPFFGQLYTCLLSPRLANALFIPSGFGHGILGIAPLSTIHYVTSSTYTPERDITINPHDSHLNLNLPSDVILSKKDAQGLSLQEAKGYF